MRTSIVALLGLIGAVAVARRVFVLVRVTGNSMAPTLESGELVLGRRAAACGRGDVIVFRTPPERADTSPKLRVKRVVACSGDPVPPWMRSSQNDSCAVVPERSFVVAGDGIASEDSRQLGFIRADDVLGVLFRR